MYPDGHVIRGWENFIKDKISQKSGRRMLDFGCWNGTHANYFFSKKFEVFGADIVESAVNAARASIPTCSGNFYTISDRDNLTSIFKHKFDLIFSNQTLYFLDDETFSKRLDEFDQMLSDDGLVFFTMMTRRNYFATYSTGVGLDGLEQVVFPQGHKFQGKSPKVRFIESFNHLKAVFCRFPCLTAGKYDVSLNETESAEHYIFIGRKR